LKQQKTGKLVAIPLLPDALEIVEEWVALQNKFRAL
jgi:hypothetical protein